MAEFLQHVWEVAQFRVAFPVELAVLLGLCKYDLLSAFNSDFKSCKDDFGHNQLCVPITAFIHVSSFSSEVLHTKVEFLCKLLNMHDKIPPLTLKPSHMHLHVNVLLVVLKTISVKSFQFVVHIIQLLLSHLLVSLDIFKLSYFLVDAGIQIFWL